MGSAIDGTSYISDRNGNPNVFKLERNEDGLWLNDNWANPGNRWNPENRFVFTLRNYFFPRLGGVFCGPKLFLQPQNILPISSSLIAISSYCLWEINLASQVTVIRNLRISVIKMHSVNRSAFFSFSLKYEVYEISKRSRNLFSILVPSV